MKTILKLHQTTGFIKENTGLPALPVYDCGAGAFSLVFENARRGDFDALSAALREHGFVAYQTTRIKDNAFETLTAEDMSVQLAFSGAEKRLQATVDPKTALFPVEEYEGPRSSQTEFFFFETDHSMIDCGMCCILRLCDGSFFVIDSGHFLAVNDHDRMYRFMRERTPEGKKIHIAGWFFTHGHDDHVCKARDYIKKYAHDTVIERIYLNLVPEYHRDAGAWSTSVRDITVHFRDFVYTCGIPVVKLHTGQRFTVCDASFTVLCTHEDVYPRSNGDYNDSSVVLMAEIAGQKIFIPGDASAVESEILEKRYGYALKCDIVQVAHHAHFGLSENLYGFTKAEVALFPTTYIFYLQDLEKYAATRTVNDLAKERFVSSDGTVGLPLPYTIGSAEVFPDETFEDFDALWGYEYTDEFKRSLKYRFLSKQ